MTTHARTFVDAPATREQVPLLIGLMGPSGGGKTYSALRLATGIQTITGGDIYCIDTEARRALHYADQFNFRHIAFEAPFGSLDYLAAMRHCVGKGAKVIIVDSMSHEHSGSGGYLQTHESEVDRMAGSDLGKRERVKMAGWIRPSGLRQQMINGILQLNANFIFCFRAKEKTKPKKGGGIEELGFMPISGEEILFEMTVNCLLLPKAGGVPTWRSDQIGEKMMMKLPKQFETVFAKEQPLDETIGAALATWAKGGPTISPRTPLVSHTAAVEEPAPSHQSLGMGAGGAGDESVSPQTTQPVDATAAEAPAPSQAPIPKTDAASGAGVSRFPDEPLSLQDMAREAAARGEDVFQAFYKGRTAPEKAVLRGMGEEIRQIFKQAKEDAPT
jgi:ABC-type dipeptide/oligopeptide/nickel transport system ATPase subunit